MPKILINEIDRTSPGTPDNYANYSVLIAGYKGRQPILAKDITYDAEGNPSAKADKIQPDSNGVYEFSSKQDFEDIIGLTDVKKDFKYKAEDGEDSTRTEYHYGNSMAYELLNLGYTVIYVPIESVHDMNTEAFWEIFKDKASYDFRFVSHGLLESTGDNAEYKKLAAELAEIELNIKKLKEIKDTVEAIDGFSTKTSEEQGTLYEEEYDRVIGSKDGSQLFRDPATFDKSPIYFDSYEEAKAVYAENTDGVVLVKANKEKAIEEHNKANISVGVINNVNSHITKLARYVDKDPAAIPGRGDCVALIELDEKCYVTTTSKDRPENLIIDGINSMAASIADDGAYCALTVPSVYYKMSNEIKKLPGAFHYLACFMNSLRAGFAEWYAAAGYTRGVSSYVIDHTSVKLGEIAINALEPRNLVDDPARVQPAFACNVIANFRGSYYLWGNRTAHKLGAAAGGNDLVAWHFLNIRQLCSTLKKQLYVACRRFTFDPNSDVLWFNFVNAITPTLNIMKADQGIRDYKILKVFTDKKATLKAKIRIIPIEAVEDFDLEVSLEDSFGSVSVATN